MNLKTNNPAYIIIAGLFLQLLILSFFALFSAVDSLFYTLNSLLSITIFLCYFKEIKQTLGLTKKTFYSFSTFSKTTFISLAILAIAICSTSPILYDNESYYIQTIKWINNYGFIKGLANLHPFFAQNSGLHLLQSSFNFSFFTNRLNDINGFLMIIFSFLCLQKLESFFKMKNWLDLFLSLILCCTGFFFPFISSPSPDFPLFLIVPLIIYLFLKNEEKDSKVILITIFSLFITLIKVTIFPILILPIYLLFSSKTSIRNVSFFLLLSAVSLLSFCLKNYVISGYPLYPLSLGSEMFSPDWKLPNFIHNTIFAPNENAIDLSFSNYRNINYYLNLASISVVILFPFIFTHKKKYNFLFFYILIQFLALFFTSFHYRFFAPVSLSIILLIASRFLSKKEMFIKPMICISILGTIFIIFLGGDLKFISKNSTMTKVYTFKAHQLFYPESNTQFKDTKYRSITIDNFKCFVPIVKYESFWQTFDGPIPCTSEYNIEYNKKFHKIVPSLRGKTIKEGFFSKKIEK
ncbi:hypothetical protein MWN40_04855 [Ornithobacterium rhinotracheale]|nr:hypothetical protein [Ornithobacterium rhinotracheale]MCK0205074.1 hypothetical protein [Ornithobacterium rhinotracheale]